MGWFEVLVNLIREWSVCSSRQMVLEYVLEEKLVFAFDWILTGKMVLVGGWESYLSNVSIRSLLSLATVSSGSLCDVRLVSLPAKRGRNWWPSVECWFRKTRSWGGSYPRDASPSWRLSSLCRRSTARSWRAAKMVRKTTSLVFVGFSFLFQCLNPDECVFPIPLRAEWLYHPARRGGGGHAEHYSCPAAAAEGVPSANVSDSGLITRSWTQQDFPRSLRLLRRSPHAARAGRRPPWSAGERLREGHQRTKQRQLVPEERDGHPQPVPRGQQRGGRLSDVPHGLQPRGSRDQTVQPLGRSDRESDCRGQSRRSGWFWEPAQRRVRERGLSNRQRDIIDSTFERHGLHHRPPRGQDCPGYKGLQDCRVTAHSERLGLQRLQYGFVMYSDMSFFCFCFIQGNKCLVCNRAMLSKV